MIGECEHVHASGGAALRSPKTSSLSQARCAVTCSAPAKGAGKGGSQHLHLLQRDRCRCDIMKKKCKMEWATYLYIEKDRLSCLLSMNSETEFDKSPYWTQSSPRKFGIQEGLRRELYTSESHFIFRRRVV